MSRRNIFEIAELNTNLAKETNRIIDLFENYPTISINNYLVLTLRQLLDQYVFISWNSRGHCINLADFLEVIEYDKIKVSAQTDVNSFITLIELMLNFTRLSFQRTKSALWCGIFHFSTVHLNANFDTLNRILLDGLFQYNQKEYYDESTEQVIIIEDKPEVTAVAEIIEEPLVLPVIKYNHHSIKGDLSAKKDILLKLGSSLEGKKNQLEQISPKLKDSVFFILNNLNLRHNNCDPSLTKNYKKAVDDMTDEALEEWYDELYQMMLLAFLEIDNINRMKKVAGLKTTINGGTK